MHSAGGCCRRQAAAVCREGRRSDATAPLYRRTAAWQVGRARRAQRRQTSARPAPAQDARRLGRAVAQGRVRVHNSDRHPDRAPKLHADRPERVRASGTTSGASPRFPTRVRLRSPGSGRAAEDGHGDRRALDDRDDHERVRPRVSRREAHRSRQASRPVRSGPLMQPLQHSTGWRRRGFRGRLVQKQETAGQRC